METQFITCSPWTVHLARARGLVTASILLTCACDHTDPASDAAPIEWVSRSATAASITQLSAGDGETWALTDTGTIVGWGERYCDSSGCLAPAEIAEVELGGTAVEVSSNGSYTAVRLVDGTVQAWDAGTGAPTPRAVWLRSGELAAGLAVGADVLCIRMQDGDVRCDSLAATQSAAALASAQLEDTAIDVSAGDRHACALLSSGQVQCWGDDDSGQLGGSAPTGVTTIALDGPAHQVVAGGEHTCALLDTGAVQCWGGNAEGQLGHTSAGVGTVPLPEAAHSLAAGARHACAVAESGSLYCWGNDDLGQLGAGEDLGTIRRVELGAHTATAVFAGSTAWTTFAVLDHGGLRGWGGNDVGQMGYGDLLGPGGGTSWDVGTLPDIDIYDGPEEG